VLYTADPEKGAELVACYPSLLEAVVRAPDEPLRVLIVRPDGYVGFSAEETDWVAVSEYLQALAPASG
jgi:hypothetical protein